jgi:tRNA A-37 threonylcarbamoyl transferase component Bud32
VSVLFKVYRRKDSEKFVINRLSSLFPNNTFNPNKITLLQQGGNVKSAVFRYKDANFDLTIKSYYQTSFLYRMTLAKIMLRREYKILSLLRGIDGITDVSYTMPDMLVYSYISGNTIRYHYKMKLLLKEEFFSKMEELIHKIHERGIIHLDLRNKSNVLCGQDVKPYLIDFTSALSLRILPKRLRQIAKNIDISSVYKAWELIGETPLPPDKKKQLNEANKILHQLAFRWYLVKFRTSKHKDT